MPLEFPCSSTRFHEWMLVSISHIGCSTPASANPAVDFVQSCAEQNPRPALQQCRHLDLSKQSNGLWLYSCFQLKSSLQKLLFICCAELQNRTTFGTEPVNSQLSLVNQTPVAISPFLISFLSVFCKTSTGQLLDNMWLEIRHLPATIG